MRTFKFLLYFLLFVFSSAVSFGQSWLWGDAGSASHQAGVGYSVAIDRMENVYFTGEYSYSMTLGSFTINDSSEQMYLSKCDANGDVIWLKQALGDEGSSSYGYSVATDSSANVYVSGTFSDTISIGAYSLKEGNLNSGIFLAKYDSSGNVLWAKQGDVTYQGEVGEGSALTTDSKGDVYMAGYFTDSVYFGSNLLLSQAGGQDIFISKYDANGNVLWAKQAKIFNYFVFNQPYSITTDKTGNVYLAGAFQDTIIFGDDTLITPSIVSGSDQFDVFLVKYDTGGNVLWARQGRISPGGFCYGFGVATDNSRNVYINGNFQDSLTFDTSLLLSPGIQNMYLTKYDSMGNLIWAKQSTGNGGWPGGSLSIDKQNNIYASGVGAMRDYSDTLKWGNFILSSNKSRGHYESAFIIRLDTSGNAICGSILPNGSYADGGSIVSDQSGNSIYLANTFAYDSIFCGPDTLVSQYGTTNPYLARWQNCDSALITKTNKLKWKNEELTVYPNPFSTTTTVFLSSQYSLPKTYYLELDDITGRKLRYIEFEGSQYELFAGGLAKGLYFVRVFGRSLTGNYTNCIGTTKIVVQ